MRIYFEKHPGEMDDAGIVTFYGLTFESITEAAAMLRYVKYYPDTEYRGFYYSGHKCIEDLETGQVCVKGMWLPDSTFISEFIRKSKQKSKHKS